MTSASFNRAVDFSTLAKSASGGNQYVTDIDEGSFDELVRKSMQHPVVLELHTPRAHGAAELSQSLRELAAEAAGKFLLARVNIDDQPRIAQALRVQAAPTVLAIIGGQLAPLFQGTADKADISKMLDQVLKTAAANGIMGKADPVSAEQPKAEEGFAEPDPRFAGADQALASGDYAKAVEEFDRILSETPHDSEAIAGRAQAALLDRVKSLVPETVAEKATAEPGDLAAQLDAADLDVVKGKAAAAFDRLLGLAAEAAPEEREVIRVRLLELFETVGRTHPAVLKARRRLSGLLF